MTTSTVPDAPSTSALERDWRFAELVVWTHLDPTLLSRYYADPATVLGEFGLLLPTGTPAPPLERAPKRQRVVITDLDNAARADNTIVTCLKTVRQPKAPSKGKGK